MNVSAIQSGWAGRVIDGRFTLLRWLGGSDQSGVFLTELPGTPPQKAAIKLMPAEAGPAIVPGASLSHPHLMRVFESGRCEMDGSSLAYVITEFADEILADILPMRPLTPDEVKEMLVPVVDALTYIHGHGLVHGRLKPSNILVVNDQLKLSADSLQHAGGAARVAHTLSAYDAPECAEGVLSPAEDVWSLGMIVIEALTQRTPDWNYAKHSDPQILESVLEPFAEVAALCLRVDPARRGTLDDIKKCLGLAVSIPAPASVPSESKARTPQASFKLRPGVLTVFALVTIAVIALFWSRSHEPQPEPPLPEQAAASQSSTAPTPAQPELQSQVQTPIPVMSEQQPKTITPPPNAPTSAPATPAGNASASGGAVVHRVMPDVLPSARQSIRGSVNVSIRVSVDPSGNVTDAAFESAGPSKYFAKVAMDAARQWKFKPAQANGLPAASVWTLHFVFTRENTDVTVEQGVPQLAH